ncbi:MAG: RNA methyltransferase [Limnochordia bacterium]
MEISSSQNERIKFVKKLYRRRYRDEYGLYLAEGLRLVEDLCVTSSVRELYYTKKLTVSERGRRLLDRIAAGTGARVYLCTEKVFGEISDTDADQGVLAVLEKPQPVVDWEPQLKQGMILVLDRIQDPGNLGTIIRTAAAAGVDGLWLVDGTVDPFNPKVVRASMGAVGKLAIASVTAEGCVALCERLGLNLAAAALGGAVPYYNHDFSKPCALSIGNEANGVQPYLLEHSRAKVSIPLANDVESLNAAAAAAILIYEMVRQRRFMQL